MEDDDIDPDDITTTESLTSMVGAPTEAHSHIYSCFGHNYSVLPCCRSHKGKYLDRKKKMDGCPEVVVKQYPLRSTGTSSKNPMMVNKSQNL